MKRQRQLASTLAVTNDVTVTVSSADTINSVKKEYKLLRISGQETREMMAAEDAQALVDAGAAESGTEAVESVSSSSADIHDKASPDTASATEAPVSSGWQHAEWELGRKLVGEVEGGEVAAVREVCHFNKLNIMSMLCLF